MLQAIQYLRRSTEKGQDLSFDRQELIINDFCEREGISIVGTFTDTTSGSNDERDGLNQAISIAKKSGLPIVVSSISRLSRSVAFGSQLLQDSSLTFYVAELGMKADPFLLNVLLCVAQKERETISYRTSTALKSLKNAGVKLGNPKWEAALSIANQVRLDNAARNQVKYLDAINMIRNTGITSYNGIARKMNDLGIKSPRGKRVSPQYVKDLIVQAA